MTHSHYWVEEAPLWVSHGKIHPTSQSIHNFFYACVPASCKAVRHYEESLFHGDIRAHMQCLWRVPLILFQINRVTIGLRWRSEGLHETCSPGQGRYTGRLRNFLCDALRCIHCAVAQRLRPPVNPLRWRNGRRRCKWPWLLLEVSSCDAVLTPQLSFLETH